MRHSLWVLAAWITLSGTCAFAQKSQPASSNISWKRTTVDSVFRSEGVAVADFNKDGKLDIFTGDVWYEAPDWKMHVVRRDKPFDPHGYSESFGCFADDYSGDGYPDVVVIPFPGKQCPWYENPGKAGGKWKEHICATSACNETPIYVDLFKTGKKVLLMGWNPAGKDNMGEMCYFTPGKDPTQLWEKHSVSGPSSKGKEIPGTRRFSHGLGHGDVNGDGRNDVLSTEGWWEQPEKLSDAPWKFHPAKLGAAAADMYAKDITGNKLADVISTSAHGFGLWLHKQTPGKGGAAFQQEPLLTGEALVKNPKNHRLEADEKAILDAVNKFRATQKVSLPAFKPAATLCATVRKEANSMVFAAKGAELQHREMNTDAGKAHVFTLPVSGRINPAEVLKTLLASKEASAVLRGSYRDIGLAVARGAKTNLVQIHITEKPTPFRGPIVVWDEMAKIPVSQTHALIDVDIDGDGLNDFVTGRRWWAHGAAGDPASAEPAFVFWFRASKDATGKTTFAPEVIDDDSGIGTQFVVVDIDGDGLPDIVVSNERGVFINQQVRAGASAAPGRKE